MAYKSNNIVAIDDSRVGSFANVTVQNNGFLEVNSSDGFQGTVAGYAAGGYTSSAQNIIDKFPFATDTNATDVGDLTVARPFGAGASSTTHGYTAGTFGTNVIDKFPFAVDTNATDVGNLLGGEGNNTSTGNSSDSHGYAAGGGSPSVPFKNTIQKWPFSADSNAIDVGDLTRISRGQSSQSSTTHGYSSGGETTPGPSAGPNNIIDKFPFATDTNASDVGDMTQARQFPTGQSSTTHGYVSGGAIPTPNTPPIVNTIEKFPFAADTNATDIADLTQVRNLSAGQSSTVSGYTGGGNLPPNTNVIDKFPFATDTNATDVGDLTVARFGAAGQQD